MATTEYFYDANGNQIGKLFNDLTDQTGAAASISLENQPGTPYYEYYEYDGFNRLTTYLTPTTTAEYTYNTQGLRISKTVNGQETKHIWDGSHMVMELNGSDQVIDKYIRGSRLIKSDINGYYLYNAHGDVIQLTDQQGTLTRSYMYDAFGIEQEAQTNDPNPFRYCGEYLDSESGNVYLRARYYDPEMGRFISEDPIRDGLNWYAYCGNDPVNYIDPSGNSISDIINVVVTVVNGLLGRTSESGNSSDSSANDCGIGEGSNSKNSSGSSANDCGIGLTNTLGSSLAYKLMSASTQLIDFVAQYELFFGVAYRGADSQNLTIGYGHVIQPGEHYNSGLTQAEAKELLLNDLQCYEDAVNEEIQGLGLSQHQFDALVSFTYNVGISGFKNSTLLKKVKNGTVTSEDFEAWSMCNGKRLLGLWRRRVDEWQMYSQGDYTRDYPNW